MDFFSIFWVPSSMIDGNFQFLISSRFQIEEDLRLKGPAYHKKNVPQDVLSPFIEDNRIFCQREFTKIQRILSCKGLSGMCAIIRYHDVALSTTRVISTEGALRLSMTYDNHPIPSIHPSHPSVTKPLNHQNRPQIDLS